MLKRYKTKQFIEIVENAELIEEFDTDLFFTITDFCCTEGA
ncbi:hypothetical protein ACJDU8_11790 [Clostridium sp. WILCCON 0269]|uniref:Uncharacterized protein n=1 Tax=Candidatus Clostridium eludens TaxID=3381663 RepID=A0ABW8SM26_9CLOT